MVSSPVSESGRTLMKMFSVVGIWSGLMPNGPRLMRRLSKHDGRGSWMPYSFANISRQHGVSRKSCPPEVSSTILSIASDRLEYSVSPCRR